MPIVHRARPTARRLTASSLPLALAGTLAATACAPAASTATNGAPMPAAAAPAGSMSPTPPSPDPRVGLRAGRWDAGEAVWNLRVVSTTRPPARFVDGVNSDLAFRGNLVFQGNFNGTQVWDIANPASPTLAASYFCPASQSDVSVYRNLLFVSGEDMAARVDCGEQGVREPASAERFRGVRIVDITDVANPKPVAVVQTCRGSHTHTLLVDPRDTAHVYVYVSGSAPVRPAQELTGCVSAPPDRDPNSALFRIEVVKVPLADPAKAAIVSSPRIFQDLVEPPTHGAAPDDAAMLEAARARGEFVVSAMGQELVLPAPFARAMLDSVVKARNGTGAPTGADSAALRSALPGIIARMFGQEDGDTRGPRPGPNQCHDITVYPAIGRAGGACEGYGLLLDISDPANPVRLGAVADSNFSYWHSATFNNDGSKVLFTDEWGGGGAPKCRASDPKEWGANALFTVEGREMRFQSYYKLPAAQTPQENCVAHNGSLIPIPGRDVMVQAWYQGGISIFDWTDAKNPVEIAFHDRGPVDSARMEMAGSWSVYWYNGLIVSSEIARGLDILELVPSAHISQNEIDAAKTVRWDYLNAQGQQRIVWPPSFALARAYADQLERSRGLPGERLTAVRQALANAERLSGAARRDALTTLATELDGQAAGSSDAAKARLLAGAVRELAGR